MLFVLINPDKVGETQYTGNVKYEWRHPLSFPFVVYLNAYCRSCHLKSVLWKGQIEELLQVCDEKRKVILRKYSFHMLYFYNVNILFMSIRDTHCACFENIVKNISVEIL